MKVLVIVLGFLLVSNLAFGAVTADVVKTDIDNNGNIRVWVVHKIDGVEVVSQYPKINDHYVFCTRYSKQNFKDLTTKAQIETYILNDIKNYSNTLVQKEFDKKAPKTLNQIKIDYNASTNQTFADTNLDKLVGKNLSVTEFSQQLDINNDGVNDKTIILKPDGSKIETDIP